MNFCDLQPKMFIRNATFMCMWGLEFVSVLLEWISFIGHTRRFIVQQNEYLWDTADSLNYIYTLFKDGYSLWGQGLEYYMYFMSFCRILSTLCSQVVFHNIPHFGKRAGQKVQRKIAVAVQNVKPLYFLSRSFALSPQKSAELFYMFL